MAKECPSCHVECSEVYQCDKCGHMFCKWCGRPAFFSGGPIRACGACPVCEPSFWGPFHTKVSIDDDDTPASEESSSSDQEVTSDDESPYSSPDYNETSSDSSCKHNTSSSSGGGEGIIAFVLIGALAVLIFVAVTASLDERHRKIISTNQANQLNQAPQVSCTGISADGTRCYNEKYGWISRNSQGQIVSVPPPPGTEEPRKDTYFFQNTIPGTYNMGKNQGQVKLNSGETETHKQDDASTSETRQDQRIVGTWKCEQLTSEFGTYGTMVGITVISKVEPNQYAGQFQGTATSILNQGNFWFDTRTSETRSRSVILESVYSFVDDNTVKATGTAPTSTVNGITIGSNPNPIPIKFLNGTLSYFGSTPTGGTVSLTCTKLASESSSTAVAPQ